MDTFAQFVSSNAQIGTILKTTCSLNIHVTSPKTLRTPTSNRHVFGSCTRESSAEILPSEYNFIFKLKILYTHLYNPIRIIEFSCSLFQFTNRSTQFSLMLLFPEYLTLPISPVALNKRPFRFFFACLCSPRSLLFTVTFFLGIHPSDHNANVARRALT